MLGSFSLVSADIKINLMNVDQVFEAKVYFLTGTYMVWWRKKKEPNRNAYTNMSYLCVNKELKIYVLWGSVYVTKKKMFVPTARSKYIYAWSIYKSCRLHLTYIDKHFGWIKCSWCWIRNRLICQYYCWMHVILFTFSRFFLSFEWSELVLASR